MAKQKKNIDWTIVKYLLELKRLEREIKEILNG